MFSAGLTFVVAVLLFLIWGALGKLNEHIAALRRIAEERHRYHRR